MLSSPANPHTRLLYDIHHEGPTATIKLNREIHLPEIAGDFCIGGGGGGFIFTLPTRCSSDIVAFNPSSGRRLPLPPTSTLPPLPIRELRPDKIASFLPRVTYDEAGETLQVIKPGGETVTIDLHYISLFQGTATLSPSLDMAVITRCFPCFPLEPAQAYFASLTSTSSSSSWTPLPFPCIKRLCDSIFHKNHLLFLDKTGTIVTMVASGDPLKPRPILKYAHNLLSPYDDPLRGYLVESPDGQELLSVWKISNKSHTSGPTETNYVRVFRLDTNDRYKWKEVNTLGGLAFFVGPGRSIALSTAHHPCLKPDFVYFTDHTPFGYLFPAHEEGLGDTGVFSLRDETVRSFQLTDEEVELKWPPPIWVVPGSC